MQEQLFLLGSIAFLEMIFIFQWEVRMPGPNIRSAIVRMVQGTVIYGFFAYQGLAFRLGDINSDSFISDNLKQQELVKIRWFFGILTLLLISNFFLCAKLIWKNRKNIRNATCPDKTVVTPVSDVLEETIDNADAQTLKSSNDPTNTYNPTAYINDYNKKNRSANEQRLYEEGYEKIQKYEGKVQRQKSLRDNGMSFKDKNKDRLVHLTYTELGNGDLKIIIREGGGGGAFEKKILEKKRPWIAQEKKTQKRKKPATRKKN